jgi:transcriptional regulator with XRE-family HTH domain
MAFRVAFADDGPLDAARPTKMRVLRQFQSMTQAELSRRTGLAQPTLSAMERGMVVSPTLQEAVADVLGCKPDELQRRVRVEVEQR